MTDVLFLGGVLNFVDPFIGLQLYLWGFLAIIVLSVLAWLAWRYGQWEAYKPVWGLFYAFKGDCSAAFIFNAGLISELLSEKDAKCIFDYSKIKYTGIGKLQKFFFNYATVFLPDLPPAKALIYKFGGRNLDVDIAKKMQNYEWEGFHSVNVGGVHTDIILDADRWTVKDSPQHKIIETQADAWNDDNPENQIHAYSKYQRLLREGLLPCPAGIKEYITVPWSRIDSSFVINSNKDKPSGALRQYARELEEQDNNSLSKYYMPILLGGMGFAALMLICRMGMKIIGGM